MTSGQMYSVGSHGGYISNKMIKRIKETHLQYRQSCEYEINHKISSWLELIELREQQLTSSF